MSGSIASGTIAGASGMNATPTYGDSMNEGGACSSPMPFSRVFEAKKGLPANRIPKRAVQQRNQD
jgi:hypothetical protein